MPRCGAGERQQWPDTAEGLGGEKRLLEEDKGLFGGETLQCCTGQRRWAVYQLKRGKYDMEVEMH